MKPTETEKALLCQLAVIGCEKVCPDNPLRVAASVSYLVDLLVAVEHYLDRFDRLMMGAGQAKKEGMPTLGTASKVSELHSELQMWASLARMKLGAGARSW